jgi:hypothetical protein
MEDKKMKEIKHISLSEIILIPAKEKFEEDYLLSHYVGSLNGSDGECSTTVHIMLFNCSNIMEIGSIIDSEVKNLEDYLRKNPEVKEISTQIDFFSKLKEDIKNSPLYHDPPEELIDCLSSRGFKMLDKNNLIFLSGVGSLVEV